MTTATTRVSWQRLLPASLSMSICSAPKSGPEPATLHPRPASRCGHGTMLGGNPETVVGTWSWPPTARRRDRGQVPAGRAGAAQGQGAAVGRALLGRRTLIQAWASTKSFRPKDGSGEPPAPGRNGDLDFHGEQRTNDSHASTTDPEARLFRKGKGKEFKLCFMGHALMENRHGLLVDGRVGEANGTAEREVAETMLAGVPGRHSIMSAGTRTSTPPASSRRCAS